MGRLLLSAPANAAVNCTFATLPISCTLSSVFWRRQTTSSAPSPRRAARRLLAEPPSPCLRYRVSAADGAPPPFGACKRGSELHFRYSADQLHAILRFLAPPDYQLSPVAPPRRAKVTAVLAEPPTRNSSAASRQIYHDAGQILRFRRANAAPSRRWQRGRGYALARLACSAVNIRR